LSAPLYVEAAGPRSFSSVHDEVVRAQALSILDFFEQPWTAALPREQWVPWRAFLAATFGLPLSGPELAVFQEATKREQPPLQQVREAWLICGRRSRKSAVAAIIAAYLACYRDYRPYLAPGSRALIPVIAQSKGRANEILGYLRGIFAASAGLAELVAPELLARDKWTFGTPILVGSVVIEVFAASFRTARGFTAVGAIFDEIAFWHNEDSSRNPDHEIVSAVKPGLATIPDSLVVGLSSPYARRGVLWERYERHYGTDSQRVLVWQAPTTLMWPNNQILAGEIQAAYEEDALSARAEYGAEFRTDIEIFLPGELVDGVTVPGEERKPIPGTSYQAFVDPSGGTSDSFALAIGHWDRMGEWAAIDKIREWTAPYDPEAVCGEVASELRRWNVQVVTGDKYAGRWPTAMFRRYGIAYQQSKLDKRDIYLGFLPLVSSASVELPTNKRLRAQLVSLERRPTTTRDIVDHPPGGHDDVANAVAGCCVEIYRQQRPQQQPKEPPPDTLKELHRQRVRAAMRPGRTRRDPLNRRTRV
jgi:hypothetical protein